MMKAMLDKLVQHFSKQGTVVLLESQSDDHPASRYSYLAALPEATIMVRSNRIEITENGETTSVEGNPWDILSTYRGKWDDWLFGYLGYDLKNHIEVLYSKNPDVVDAPDLFFMKPGFLLRVDRHQNSCDLLKGEMPDALPALEISEQISISDLHSNVSKEQYLRKIKAVQNQIYEGDYYEINLSHQLQAKFGGNPFQLYRQMRDAGPVPFAAYIRVDDLSICSLSPERFLRKEGSDVFSQPIKGTIKRHDDEQQDSRLKQELMDSAKNRAENLMIVDLVRNDLNRIAVPGSVEVSDLFEIQTFGTVHQMVSTISAQAIVRDPIEILKACYPMGSMTGAPKISAMQSIEELENYRRGIYSGAIGYFSPEDNFDFNVVIRTAIIKNGLLCYAVGGAITGDSDPDEEWQETWLKAKALTDSVRLPQPQ